MFTRIQLMQHLARKNNSSNSKTSKVSSAYLVLAGALRHGVVEAPAVAAVDGAVHVRHATVRPRVAGHLDMGTRGSVIAGLRIKRTTIDQQLQ